MKQRAPINLVVPVYAIHLALTGCIKTSKTGAGDQSSIRSSAPREQLDTTLVGFDVVLPLTEFQKKYAEKISACTADSYSKREVGEEIKLPVIICKFKDVSGFAQFYNGSIYRFEAGATSSNVKLRLAAEQLTKKSGNPSTETTFSGSYSAYCAATVAFASGTAAVLSDDIIVDLVELRQRGVNQTECSPDIFIKKDWHSILFDNDHLKELMNSELIKLRDEKERKSAGEVKL